MPESPGGLLNDQVGHFIIGGVLSTGVLSLSRRLHTATLVALLVSGGLAGAAIELAQRQFLDGRRAQLTDLVADLVGVAAGMVVVAVLRRSIGRRNSRRLVAVALTLLLVGTLLGPVRRSPEVQRWIECRVLDEPAGPDIMRTLPALVDGGTWLDGNGEPVETSAGAHRLSDAEPTALLRAARCRRTFSVLATVSTADLGQAGPTRMVALSEGTRSWEQNFHLGQEGNDLSVRFRSTHGSYEQFRVEKVFLEAGTPIALAVRVAEGRLEVFIDGELRSTFRVPTDALDTWSDLPLSVGDEFTDDRTFDGEIVDVRVTADWLDDAELTTH